MSEEQAEVVRKVYAMWNRDPDAMAKAVAAGDFSAKDLGLELIDPEMELHQAALIFDTAGTFHGHEGMLRAAQELFNAFGTIEWVLGEWMEEGDWQLVSATMVAVGELSGIKTETALVHAWRVRDGLVTDLHVYPSLEKALEALRPRA